jgi:trans-aconitate methyltransferase
MTSEADNIIGLYQRHGLEWAQERGTELFEGTWLDRFLALQPPKPSVLDIGCGSAEPIGRYLIEKGAHLTGVDSSPPLIELSKSHFPSQDWRIADMRTLSIDRTYHGILAWDSFFHLCPDDQRRMFAVFKKHAAARAALMFTSGTAYGVAMGSFRNEALYHASLDPEEYRALLESHSFSVAAHVVEDPSCGRRTIWLAQLR